MTVREALSLGQIDPLDRELIIGAVLKKDRAFVLAHPEACLTKRQMEKIKRFIQEREAKKPLAYILGEKEFFGLSFFVNRFTLIPRPETEMMVEETLKLLATRKKLTSKKKIAVIDVGTGSGCIIVSVVKNFLIEKKSLNFFSFFAVDTSLRALSVAKKNAKHHSVSQQITFLQSNLLKAFTKQLEVFDEIIILANLPYLSEKIYAKAETTVRDFEPKSALVSGKDGLDHYRKLLKELEEFSKEKKVHFLLEISPEQAKFIPTLLSSHRTTKYHILPDLTGRARLIIGSF